MLPRLFATAFATRMTQRSLGVRDDSLAQTLLATGVALAAGPRRRTLGIAMIAAGGLIAVRHGRRARAARR